MSKSEELKAQKEAREKKILEGSKARMAKIQNTTEQDVQMPEEYHKAQQQTQQENQLGFNPNLVKKVRTARFFKYYQVFHVLLVCLLLTISEASCLIPVRFFVPSVYYFVRGHKLLIFFGLEILMLQCQLHNQEMMIKLRLGMKIAKMFVLRLAIYVLGVVFASEMCAVNVTMNQ